MKNKPTVPSPQSRDSEQAGEKAWTVSSVLKWTTDFFAQHDLASARLDAEVLLAHVLKRDRLALYLHYEDTVPGPALKGYRQLIRRRVNHEPIAYITGMREFYSISFAVEPSVLIPRPETEHLVEYVLEHVKENAGTACEEALRLLEIGTGSGIFFLHGSFTWKNWLSMLPLPATFLILWIVSRLLVCQALSVGPRGSLEANSAVVNSMTGLSLLLVLSYAAITMRTWAPFLVTQISPGLRSLALVTSSPLCGCCWPALKATTGWAPSGSRLVIGSSGSNSARTRSWEGPRSCTRCGNSGPRNDLAGKETHREGLVGLSH